ncbi:MAG: hypothetical protein KDD47_20470, partial [Acidobacteria bacterium]|nr:hypothetical protein [Acidobacteriota bacterium]
MSGGSSGALRGWICLVAAVWIGGAGQAEETGTNLGESVQIHGFGGWAFGSSSPWPYLTGRGGGEAEYENGEFALNISAQPSNRLHVAAQFFWEVTPDGTEEIEMDYAFAEWSFSDRLRLRAGQVKFPFGIYGEILDVGTLRPFFTLPQSIYGDNELESEAYLGLGVTGSKDLGSGWRLAYDIYGGGLDLEVGESLTDIFEGGAEEELPGDEQGRREKVENLVGGRISFTSPSGISLGLSVHTGEVLGDEAQGEAGSSWGEEVSYGLFVEYLGDLWQIRSEVGYRRDLDDPDFQGVYLEAG